MTDQEKENLRFSRNYMLSMLEAMDYLPTEQMKQELLSGIKRMVEDWRMHQSDSPWR